MKWWEPSQMDKDSVAFYWFMVNLSLIVIGVVAIGCLAAFLYASFA
jgi:hypothetical protein